MAQNRPKENKAKETGSPKKGMKLNVRNPFNDRRVQLSSGFFLMGLGIFLFVCFLSYLFTWKADQSLVDAYYSDSLLESALEAQNVFGLFGALTSHYFIYRWFGLTAFFLPVLLFVPGWRIVLGSRLLNETRLWVFSIFSILWISLLLGYLMQVANGVTEQVGYLSGGVGYQLALWIGSLIGWGTYLLLALSLIIFIIFFYNVTTLKSAKNEDGEVIGGIDSEDDPNKTYEHEGDQWHNELENDDLLPDDEIVFDDFPKTEPRKNKENLELELNVNQPEPEPKVAPVAQPEFTVEERIIDEEAVGEMDNYDPTLDLSSYKYPPLDLLKEYDSPNVNVTKAELEQNKDKIIDTLVNFKIGIQSIKATIGPTVTLYEIVPDAGVKISKIKNLEDDIALSLAALGIRIIAPIPGKGTIGIEVPNKNRELVSIRSALATEKFMNSDKELPIILGKTISNEVYVVDLTKMPHLLIAGATGQGKSVGINVLLASLLYKKHPSQLKLILVDPKKVELSLFSKIERHFLAMLPDSEEAIITDTKKVVYTLNSLCIEMDNRYNLLKDGGARNLKEYNAKFVKRKLNPNNGHRFLPYIVLVIDELADLMMTAGKEVETPIARLAQLARAIGIHLVVATQRPSVNVITGIIKANFPARLSFRVTSKVDSRTILDTGGADQLIGMGDMLLSLGSDIIRLQCPFVDTPEIDALCDYIGDQRGYESAYQLPEFVGDDDNSTSMVDLKDRDALFDEAARLIVMHQQGSTSLVQRKLKLGYNRAGRIIDQLEAAGIVGPFEGSKAREVLIQDDYSLEQLLRDLDN